MTLNNLAGLLRAQGRRTEAEPMYRRALTIFEQALDAAHPKISTCLMNYAELLREVDRKRRRARAGSAEREARAGPEGPHYILQRL